MVLSEPLHFDAWRKIFPKYGIKNIDAIDFFAGVGISDLDFLAMLFPKLDTQQLTNIMHEKWSAYNDIVKEKIQPVHGVNETVDKLSKKYRLCAASSTHREAVELVLKLTNLLPKLEFMLAKEDVVNPKPAPDVYTLATKKLDLLPAECLAVEDSPSGITAAKKAGLFCIGITTSFEKTKILHADLVINSFHELSQLVN